MNWGRLEDIYHEDGGSNFLRNAINKAVRYKDSEPHDTAFFILKDFRVTKA